MVQASASVLKLSLTKYCYPVFPTESYAPRHPRRSEGLRALAGIARPFARVRWNRRNKVHNSAHFFRGFRITIAVAVETFGVLTTSPTIHRQP